VPRFLGLPGLPRLPMANIDLVVRRFYATVSVAAVSGAA
jgi:hypothetical protein